MATKSEAWLRQAGYRVINVGDRFGRLVAIEPRRVGVQTIMCRCDCGTEREFNPRDLLKGNSKSCGCGPTGRQKDPSKWMVKRCALCLAEFRTYRSDPRKFCGPVCHRKGQSLRQSKHGSHLWQGGKTSESMRIRGHAMYAEWRKAVMARDEYTCQSCFSKSTDTPSPRLAAHHIVFFSIDPRLRLKVSNGITLCRQCHRDYHRFESTKEGPDLESRLAAQAARYFEEDPGTWMLKVHGGPMQESGVPDFLGVIAGRAVGIELKVRRNFLTPRQQAVGRVLKSHGAAFFAARSMDDIRRIVSIVKESQGWMDEE